MQIKIKKKNLGKFTEYCGGKVTDECIQKAKNSKNPKLVKRAIFALNARAWKHAKGGVFKLLDKFLLKTTEPLMFKSIASNTSDSNAMAQDAIKGFLGLIKFYSSPQYYNRAIKHGFTDKQAKDLQKSLLNNLSQSKENKLISNLEIKFKQNPGENGHYALNTVRHFGDTLPTVENRIIELWGPENFATAAHEGAHASTLQYLPESFFNYSGMDQQISNQIVETAYPNIAKALQLDAKLLPESRGVWKPSYLKDLQEVRSRAISDNVVADKEGLSIDQLYSLPKDLWTNDMKQQVKAVGLDRAKQIAKNILTLGGITYGTYNYIGNNE